MTTSWTGQAGKPARMAKAEIEARLLDTARDLVRRNGLTVSLEHLRLDELMELADVPKTSFYRVWPSKEAFFARLLEDLVKPEGGVGAAFDAKTLEVVHAVVAEHAEMLATAAGREALLLEAIRLGARQNFSALLHSTSWQTYMAVLATLPGITDQESREKIQAALQQAENYFLDRMATFYAELLPTFQYQLREGVTPRHVAAAGAAIVEGLVQRYVVNPELVDGPLPGPSLDGRVTEWHLAALGFAGVISALAEPRPGI